MNTRHSDPNKAPAARLAKTAVIGSLGLMGALAPAPAVSAESVKKKPVTAVVTGLKKLNHIKVSDRIKELDGKTSNLVVNKGATAYKYSEGHIKKFKLPEGMSVLHAMLVEKNDRQLACFRLGQASRCIDLVDPRNKGLITESYFDSRDRLQSRLFEPEHITTSTVRVDGVIYGFPYTRSGVETDQFVGQIKGAPVVPLAQAAN
jgi:hypothetical protein